ncbi:homoserine kinase [Clostridium estertheticum]|uniref:Homoserine kinase n=1 Tax=Clostridium estertheticum subsp. estertheticum TaxID=1552 RepID=A0A1J0GG43_9CLOT|nr:homoserine kinase [Clostridium estertheticum]APC40275.1 homoserine kinase [Clostridium estertheticum subsp. estertheticum]MBU3075281.1 homoserine kinase [Clostridium estertheticum]MBU3165496.1 homoserine kinase [Clostridium estertheticum]MBU3170518.1 homoserine kinase [Clostridium estertheticum]MBZ9617921.1 homoserine kinase [Clostridium estertheticum subsp. laramiense]
MFEIKVPATSANMGPGLDTLGVAFKLYNRFIVEEIESGLEIFGCNKEFANNNNLVYDSMLKTFKKLQKDPKGVRLTFKTEIPVSGGLGSSATCILAGVTAANRLCGDILTKQEVLNYACEIEGHPDNITPAMIGGMTVSIMNEGANHYNKIPINGSIKFCALIPKLQLSTKSSRAVLPETIPFKDAVYNVGMVSMLIVSLVNGDYEGVKLACKDKLHQPYRMGLIRNYSQISSFVKESEALGVFLSGAGPTIMVMLKKDDSNTEGKLKEFLKGLSGSWETLNLEIDEDGLNIENI